MMHLFPSISYRLSQFHIQFNEVIELLVWINLQVIIIVIIEFKIYFHFAENFKYFVNYRQKEEFLLITSLAIHLTGLKLAETYLEEAFVLLVSQCSDL